MEENTHNKRSWFALHCPLYRLANGGFTVEGKPTAFVVCVFLPFSLRSACLDKLSSLRNGGVGVEVNRRCHLSWKKRKTPIALPVSYIQRRLFRCLNHFG